MSTPSNFKGFPRESVRFYKNLRENNNTSWFHQHKEEFDALVMIPARDFVFEMGKRLARISPNIIADPRINKSIFRIYRDIRFSKDKTPYKTHLGIFFWEGHRPKMECPGYYFHLEPPNIMLAAGSYMFARPILEEYRQSVVHPKFGPTVIRAMRAVSKKGPYGFGREHYKRIPRGYDPGHKNAKLLLNNGLYAFIETRIPKELYSDAILDFCFEKFRDMSPIHKWLAAMTQRASK